MEIEINRILITNLNKIQSDLIVFECTYEREEFWDLQSSDVSSISIQSFN
jgi:hypothetical protein